MDPLTPADCDLRGLPFMPLDIVRVLDSDLYALSTGDEFKAAMTLLCKSWLQIPAASLPDDERILSHLSGAGARWRKLKEMALRGWVKCDDGRLYHPVVADKAKEAWKHRQAQRERANKRWGNTNTPLDGTPTAMPRHYHGTPTENAAAMQGTGTVKGEVREREKPSPTESLNFKPKPAQEIPANVDWTGALALNYVCKAADWHPPSDTQRQASIHIIDGWLALGCSLETILAGIARARARQPGERTRSLKRFDSTIRGIRGDQLGGELPHTVNDVQALTEAVAKRMEAK